MYNTIHRRIVLLIIALVIAVVPTMQASAGLVICRTDPIFLLSNGDILTVTLNIGTDVSNIREITYVLHVPAGVTVKHVTYTAGGLGTEETFEVYQDSPANTYTTDTMVTVKYSDAVNVTATTLLNRIYSDSVTGYEDTHLIVTVSKP